MCGFWRRSRAIPRARSACSSPRARSARCRTSISSSRRKRGCSRSWARRAAAEGRKPNRRRAAERRTDMKLTDFEIDVDKLEQGDWVENIPDMGDLRLKVRGSGNSDYRALQQKLLRAVPRGQSRDGRVPPEVSDRITATLLLETVLLDWDGLVGDNDEPIPYSKEMAA